jgi:predicted nucleic acid-binding protein
MNKRFTADAYAWIEYLDGSKPGEVLRDHINEGTEIYTSAVTLAEIISKAARKGRDHELAYKTITGNSTIVPADEQISYRAGILHAEIRQTIKDFGLSDAYVLATARSLDAKILTGDPHFKNIEEAIMI